VRIELHGPILGAALVACGGANVQSRTLPSAPDVPGEREAAVYPVLSDLELEARTREAEARTPGWSIVLDPFGFLGGAACDACGKDVAASSAQDHGIGAHPVLPADRDEVDEFLRAQEPILALGSPLVERGTTNRASSLTQETPYGRIGGVFAARLGGTLAITGHLWPRLPSFDRTKSDGDLEKTLRALDPDPELAVVRRFRTVRRSPSGPMELHAAVCLAKPGDLPPLPHVNAPKRPCVDATTGENLAGLGVGWSVSAPHLPLSRRFLQGS
jgi:hypothetical protein